jgi:hypothetical protein
MGNLNDFTLTPKVPLESYINRYLALMQAYGGCVMIDLPELGGVPGTLGKQYNDNVILIRYDSVENAGDYDIMSKFTQHSSIMIGVYSWPNMPADAELALFITIRAPTNEALPNGLRKDENSAIIYPEVEVFVGEQLEESYQIRDGERSFVVEFDRPTNENGAPIDGWVFIIIRPKTEYPYGFVKAIGHIVS